MAVTIPAADILSLFPTVRLVLMATVLAFKFKSLGLSIVGVPDDPNRFNSFTPKLLSAIDIFFSYL